MKRHPKGGRKMVKQQRWSREELKEWLVVIRDHWRGKDSEYGPTPMQIRTYKTGRRWEPQPLYKDFVNEFGSYEEALAAVEMKVPPDAQRKTGPTLKTQAEQNQEAHKRARARIEEAKVMRKTAKKKAQEQREVKTQVDPEKTKRRHRVTYDLVDLAKALQEACDYTGKEKITITEYTAWRATATRSDSGPKPSGASIMTRLGGGQWHTAFDEMREILAEAETVVGLEPGVAPEPEPEPEPAPEPAPEPILEPEPIPESAPEPVLELTPEQKLQELLRTHVTGTPYSKEWLIEYLRLLSAMRGGGVPTTIQLNEIAGGPERRVFQRRFGGWAEAIYAAGLIDETELSKRQEKAQKAAEIRKGPKMVDAKVGVEPGAVTEPKPELEAGAEVAVAEPETREATPVAVAAQETMLNVRVDGEIKQISVAISRMELQLQVAWQ